jgi:peptidoglycan/xylan/chitin deacetylase (PgdA/CDA1 family)
MVGKVARGKGTTGLLFFWDYDTQWGADRSRGDSGPKNWGNLEFTNTERLLELHARYQIPACFAVVGAAALPGERPYHDPAQIRRIHEAGHEIGSHSFQHDWLPGLGRQALMKSLRCSKDALEQCIGAPVTTFVPPYNQPFDYPRRWSISWSERRAASRDRTDLPRLCEALGEAGYLFCRVAYKPLYERMVERLLRRQLCRPGHLETIASISCVRLNTPGGFNEDAIRVLKYCAHSGGLVVVYGHPHSLYSGNSQDESTLIPFFEEARLLHERGMLRFYLPGRLVRVS